MSLVLPFHWKLRELVSSNFSKAKGKHHTAEIRQLLSLYGEEARTFLIACLISELTEQKGHNQPQKAIMFASEISYLESKPYFETAICQAFTLAQSLSSRARKPRISEHLVASVCKASKLDFTAQLIIGLSLSQSDNPVIAEVGVQFLKDRSPENSHGSSRPLPKPILHRLLCLIRENSKAFPPNAKSTTQFIKILCRSAKLDSFFVTGKEHTPEIAVLGPLFDPDPLPDLIGDPIPFKSLESDPRFVADFLMDLGCLATSSVTHFRHALKQAGKGTAPNLTPLTATEIAFLLGAMQGSLTNADLGNSQSTSLYMSFLQMGGEDSTYLRSNATGGPRPWNPTVVATVLREDHNRSLEWAQVWRAFDYPGFKVRDRASLEWLTKVYRKVVGSKNLPYTAIFDIWDNTAGQLSLLEQAIAAPAAVFSFANVRDRQAPAEGLDGKPNYGSPNQAWCSLELINCLLSLSKYDYAKCKELLEQGVRQSLELLLVGLAQTDNHNVSGLRRALLHKLVHRVLLSGNAIIEQRIMSKVWDRQHHALVVSAFTTAYRQQNAVSTSHAKIICSLDGCLQKCLEGSPIVYQLDMLVTVSKAQIKVAGSNDKQPLSLETWLQEGLTGELKNSIFAACLQWLKAHDLDERTYAIFFKMINSTKVCAGTPMEAEYSQIFEKACQQFPTLKEIKDNDIVEQANAYFQRIYTSRQTIEDAIEMLKRFKNSNDPRETDIFKCMIHNLFDEYRFFDKYPHTELQITGVLFGALIQHQLVQQLTLGLALRYVLDSLRKPVNDKMHLFGTFALDQFMGRLHEWPKYCAHILQISHLRQNRELTSRIKAAMGVQEPVEEEPSGNSMMRNFSGATNQRFAPAAPAAQAPSAAVQKNERPGMFAPQPVNNGSVADGPSGGYSDGMRFADQRQQTPGMPDPHQLGREEDARQLSHGGELGHEGDAHQIGHAEDAHQIGHAGDARQLGRDEDKHQLGHGGDSHQLGHGVNGQSGQQIQMQNFTGLAMHSNEQAVMESNPMDPNPPEDTDSRMHFGFDNSGSNIGNMHSSPSLSIQSSNASLPQNDGPLLHESMPEQPTAPLEEEYEEPEAPIPLPPDSTQEKLNFISNNVTDDNLEDTVKKAKVALLPEHHMWFAKYLVENRIVTQPNYHTVYHKLLRGIQRRDLDRAILHATIRHVRMLVRPSRHMESKDSKVLKNLGLWLGEFSLARNRPLLYKDINMKELLYSAYENGKLGNVLPFVAKVLHGAKSSIIFRPPNPWTMALLYALREVYDVPDLKLFLKFEVEMLVQALKLDMKTLRKANFLPKRRQPNVAESSDFVKRRAVKEQTNNVRKQIESTTPNQQKQQQQTHSPNFTLPPDFPSSTVIPNLAMYLKINPSLKIFQLYPQLKPCVAAAVDRAIRDLIQPVVHSSVAISRITACEIVPKDFSRDPDDNKMRNAAHLMGRNLAGNLALVTCKERLRVSMSNHLKTLLTSIPGLTEHFLIERACTTCALENLELGCNLIKEAATRKAKASIDEALLPTLNMRKRYKQECSATNRPFFDSRFMYKSLSIPEALKPAPGGLQVPHLRVYEAFNRPVGQPLPTPNSVSPNKMLNKQTAYQRYMLLFQKLTAIVQSLQMNAERPSSLASIPPEHEVWRTLNEIHETGELTQPAKDRLEAAHLFSQHVFKIMYNISRNYLQLEMHLLVLARLLETFKKLKVEITSWVMFAPGDDKKFNREIAVGLIQANLLQLGEYDAHIAQMLHKRRDKPTIDFAAFLITKCVITERIAKAANFPKTLDELTKVSMTDAVKYPHVVQLVHKLSSGKENQGGLILARWLEYHSMHPSATTEQVASVFLPVLEQYRVLSADETTKRFFGSMIRICVERSHLSLREKGVTDHTFADAFAQILWMIIKFVDKRVKIQMFAHAFSSVAHVIVRDFNAKAQMWDQRPYLRIFVSVLHQLNQPDPAIESAKFRFYEIIERVLHNLRPENVSGFTFAWLDLISHRTFMPKLLLSHEGKGWRMVQRLIVDLLETLKPYLETAKLTQAMRLLYKSTLRVLLVLLKDFPEFLCNFHFSFCNAIPASCIQLRNLVLSAFPRGMRLPDPFTPNLKVDRLPEIRESPQIMSDINVPGFDKVKVTLDQYLEQQAAGDVFHVLRAQFFRNDSYNIPLINAIVLYVGMQATNRIEKRNSDHDLFQLLAEGLDAEGRYHFVNAIANQLRYPNNQTHYFSCVLLLLFGRTRKEILQEQITRVLLERLIVQRPHPWGLLITFIELIKNPSYSFWDHGFTRCAPEIRRLFVSVASSCMGPAGSDSSLATNPNSVQS